MFRKTSAAPDQFTKSPTQPAPVLVDLPPRSGFLEQQETRSYLRANWRDPDQGVIAESGSDKACFVLKRKCVGLRTRVHLKGTDAVVDRHRGWS